MGEEYWSLIWGGKVLNYTWNGTPGDNDTLAIGNVFPTREAAEFEAERRRVIAELSDFAEGDDAVWDGNQKHWHIIYLGADVDPIWIDYGTMAKFAGLYFPSEEATKAAIEAVGEDRVKKYYLGVQE